MNWTGGKLQRHSKNARAGVLNRQRQHFSKIRTQLQNGTASPAPSFRPSYLHREDDDLDDRPPQLGFRAVRHVGHSKRRQRKESEDVSPVGSGRAGSHGSISGTVACDTTIRHARSATSPHSAAHPSSSHERGNHARPNGLDVHLEDHFLESSRERLLERQDWVGLAPSRPVHMQFPSRPDKDRIGKRRKLDNHSSARHLRHGGGVILQPLQPSDANARAGPLMSGAIINHPEDIRIRIGSHALATSQIPPQESKPKNGTVLTQEGSSEPMLFDLVQETYTASGQRPARQGSADVRDDSLTGNRTAEEPYQNPAVERVAECRERQLSPDHALGFANIAHPVVNDHDDLTNAAYNKATLVDYARLSASQSEAFLSKVHRRVQPGRDIENELSHSSPITIQPCVRSNDETENGCGNTVWSSSLRSKVREGDADGPQIVDDEHWKAFLAISEQSSSPLAKADMFLKEQTPAYAKTLVDGSINMPLAEQAFVHHLLSSLDSSARVGDRLERFISKKATIASPCATQGNATRTGPFSQSGISSSIDHAEGWNRSDRMSQHMSKLVRGSRKAQLHNAEEREELWKKFVFEDSSRPASGMSHDDAVSKGGWGSCTQDAHGISNRARVVPTSLIAVSSDASILPLPSKLASSTLSCLSDHLLDVGVSFEKDMPPAAIAMSGSMHNHISQSSISSPAPASTNFGAAAPAGLALSSSQFSRDSAPVKNVLRREEKSVTRLHPERSNVSPDGPPCSDVATFGNSEIESQTESRGLDRLGPGWVKGGVQPAESRKLHDERSSIHDIPDEEDDEVDLVR